MKRSRIYVLTLAACALLPGAADAAIEQIVFTTDPQSIAPSAVSAQITVEARDGGGTPVSGNSVCMHITSSSASGEFSTNETNWSSPVQTLALTLSTSQFRRNFYYRDANSGTFTLTAQAGPRIGSSCTGWTPGATWSATQALVIGTGGGTTSENTTATTTSNTTSNTNTATTTQTNTPTTSTVVSSYVPPPVSTLFADGGEDRTVIVGADTTFRGRAYNRKQEIVDLVRFNWNFGDGTTAEGMSILHHFSYPGRYAVILTIAENIYSASDKIVVTAVPAQMLFTVNDDASVSIENQEQRDIDISRWLIRSFGRTFTLPDDTVIIAGETLRISNATLGFTVGPQTELLYPNGAKVVIEPPQLPSVVMPVAAVAPDPEEASEVFKSALPQQSDTPEPAAEATAPVVEKEETVEPRATSSLAAAAESMPNSSLPWWLGAIAIALVVCGAAYAVKRMQKKEWNIIDDTLPLD